MSAEPDSRTSMRRPQLVSTTVARHWEDALISGNGRQGALVYGGPGEILITLSHERLFLPVDAPLPPPATAAILPQLRESLFDGRAQEAADEVVRFAQQEEPGYAHGRNSDPFVGAATLAFTADEPAQPGEYRRRTDFATGVVSQEWRSGAGEVRQELFVSRADDVVVARLLGGVTGRLRLASIEGTPPVPVDTAVTAAEHGLRLTATFPGHWPGSIDGYEVVCRVAARGGSVAVDGAELVVREVDELLLLARVQMPGAVALGELPADFAELLSRHAPLHGELFGRVHLQLGEGGAALESTEELLAHEPTPQTMEWLFDAGRYAIISSCGELPPTLQGVWSGSYTPAWCGGFTLDGNLQTAVAALLATGTPELLLPLFDLLDQHADDFRENAQRLYGARGILLPAHLAAHGKVNHFNDRWCLTFWTAGAAWLARFYVDYWRYTGDRAFLADRAVPFMVAAAQFYSDFVCERDGRVVFVPSYSPENDPGGAGAQATINATMDAAAVRDLLTNLLAAHAELGRSHPGEARWRELLTTLPGYRVADDGTLAEWSWPGLADNHEHRHCSHLYPLWYEPDPLLVGDAELRAAAVRTIERRWAWWRENGDEMAFGLIQLGLGAAALGLAETAHEILCHLAARYWRPSLVSTHNAGEIFNVDICGGFPALVAAMLAHSAHGRLELLPALPSAWPRGEVAGLRMRDAVTVELLSWQAGQLEAVLCPGHTGRLTVGWRGGSRPPTVSGAEVVRASATEVTIAVPAGFGAGVRLSWRGH